RRPDRRRGRRPCGPRPRADRPGCSAGWSSPRPAARSRGPARVPPPTVVPARRPAGRPARRGPRAPAVRGRTRPGRPAGAPATGPDGPRGSSGRTVVRADGVPQEGVHQGVHPGGLLVGGCASVAALDVLPGAHVGSAGFAGGGGLAGVAGTVPVF